MAGAAVITFFISMVQIQNLKIFCDAWFAILMGKTGNNYTTV